MHALVAGPQSASQCRSAVPPVVAVWPPRCSFHAAEHPNAWPPSVVYSLAMQSPLAGHPWQLPAQEERSHTAPAEDVRRLAQCCLRDFEWTEHPPVGAIPRSAANSASGMHCIVGFWGHGLALGSRARRRNESWPSGSLLHSGCVVEFVGACCGGSCVPRNCGISHNAVDSATRTLAESLTLLAGSLSLRCIPPHRRGPEYTALHGIRRDRNMPQCNLATHSIFRDVCLRSRA